MPYINQTSNLANHGKALSSQGVVDMVSRLSQACPQTEEHNISLANRFSIYTDISSELKYTQWICTDGTNVPVTLDKRHPISQLTCGQVGTVTASLDDIKSMKLPDGLVDPEKVAGLWDKHSATPYILPGQNFLLDGCDNLCESFRRGVNDLLYSRETWWDKKDINTSIGATLVRLYQSDVATPGEISIGCCPTCSNGPIKIQGGPYSSLCPFCLNRVYVADVLLLASELKDDPSGTLASNRVMLVLEHLSVINNVEQLTETDPTALGNIVYVVDGPLGIFGHAQWLNSSMLIFLQSVFKYLGAAGIRCPVIMGIIKTGVLVEHFNCLSPYIEKNNLFCIDEEYAQQHVQSKWVWAQRGYGQDFAYKSNAGDMFIFNLPYSDYGTGDQESQNCEAKWAQYPTLGAALDFINEYRSDRYPNSIFPMIVAHEFTAFSAARAKEVVEDLLNSYCSKEA